MTADGVGTCGPDDNQAQAGHLVVSALNENQRGEFTLTAHASALSRGGGKPGQGYAAIVTAPALTARYGKGTDSDASDAIIVQPLALRGRDGGAELEIAEPGSPAHSLRTNGGGASLPIVSIDLRNAARSTTAGESAGLGAREAGVSYGIPSTLRAIPGISEGTIVRRLTPLECERLQGFPDGHTDGQSDAQRYRQMGNAVAVPVVEWIARRLVAIDEELR